MNMNRTLKQAALLLVLLLAVAPMGVLAEAVVPAELDLAQDLDAVDDAIELPELELDVPDPVSEAVSTPQDEAAENAGAVAINKTNFPDNVFRGYVKESFDTDGNGKLSQTEIDAVENIDVYNKGIASLKGVERFANLKTLSCISNRLKTLDISKNRKLEMLACSYNALTKLDLSKNAKLTLILCGNNELKTLDVSNLKQLESLDCSDIGLTKLDVSKNTKLTQLLCAQNKLKALNVTRNTKLTFLSCWKNALTKLDVSKNTKLTYLSCGNNKLKTFNVSKCTQLETMDCSNNQLTKLTLGSKKNLTSLYAYGNKLKSIDLKNCPILKKMVKEGSTSAIGNSVWFSDSDYHNMAIDNTTRLTDGNKVLYRGA